MYVLILMKWLKNRIQVFCGCYACACPYERQREWQRSTEIMWQDCKCSTCIDNSTLLNIYIIHNTQYIEWTWHLNRVFHSILCANTTHNGHGHVYATLLIGTLSVIIFLLVLHSNASLLCFSFCHKWIFHFDFILSIYWSLKMKSLLEKWFKIVFL